MKEGEKEKKSSGWVIKNTIFFFGLKNQKAGERDGEQPCRMTASW